MDGTGAGTLEAWDQQGFAVLRGAAPAEAVEALPRELIDVQERLLVRAPGDAYPSLAARRDPALPAAGAVDPHVLVEAARRLLLADAVVAGLREALGGEAPLLIDSTDSIAGAPDDGPYRDPTYVPLSHPEALVGMAIALGDVELPVFPGSQRLPVDRFSGRYRHVNPERDGDGALDEHRARLRANLEESGIVEERVALAAGDVVLWHADLVHRFPVGHALVAHLAPASAEPSWFAYRPDRAYRVPYGDGCYTSRHYALASIEGAIAHETQPSPPPAAERGTPGVEAVEHALERHDEVPGTPAAPPRGRGLVGRVRGAMGRRPPRP